MRVYTCFRTFSVMTDHTSAGRIYLWVAIGTKDNPPDRLRVVVCEHCATLVTVERADRHARWHRRVEP